VKKQSKKEKLLIYVFFFFAVFSFSEKVSAYSASTTPNGSSTRLNIDLTGTEYENPFEYDYGLSENAVSGGADTFESCEYLSSQTAPYSNYSVADIPNALAGGDNVYFCIRNYTGTSGGTFFDYIHLIRTGGVWVINGSSLDGSSSSVSRIIQITPENEEIVATSTSQDIDIDGFLAEQDLNDYSKLRVHIENSAKAFENCSSVVCSEFDNNGISLDFEYNILVEGFFNYSSTTQSLPIGKYWVTATIEKGDYCFLGVCAVTQTIASKSTTFTVSTTTKADKLKTNTVEYLALLEEGGQSFENCGISDFNLFLCGSDLITWSFVPTSDAVSYFGTTIYEDVLTKFPVGYLTDFILIMSTTTVGSLTIIDATIPSALPFGQGQHIELDLAGQLDYILNATTSVFSTAEASSTETFYEITSYYWNIIISMLAFFYVLSRILGSHLINIGYKKT